MTIHPLGHSTRPPPGDPDVWFFIVADLLGFAFLFGLFIVGRAAAPELYETSRQHLNVWFGLANTVILLSSGALMAGAVQRARDGKWRAATLRLRMATAVGALFALSKAAEWRMEFVLGNSLTTNEFFTYYFALTGIHLFHYLGGIVILIVVQRSTRTAAVQEERRLRWMEAGAAYWHTVDLLWVFLFAMLYLL